MPGRAMGAFQSRCRFVAEHVFGDRSRFVDVRLVAMRTYRYRPCDRRSDGSLVSRTVTSERSTTGAVRARRRGCESGRWWVEGAGLPKSRARSQRDGAVPSLAKLVANFGNKVCESRSAQRVKLRAFEGCQLSTTGHPSDPRPPEQQIERPSAT